MFWMLHEAGASYAVIAWAAGLPRSRVHQACQSYAYQLHRRSADFARGFEFAIAHGPNLVAATGEESRPG